jgi:hypothetical protein
VHLHAHDVRVGERAQVRRHPLLRRLGRVEQRASDRPCEPSLARHGERARREGDDRTRAGVRGLDARAGARARARDCTRTAVAIDRRMP